MEVGSCILCSIRVTIKNTLPVLQHVKTLKNAVIWDDQLEYTWSWVDDRDMDWVLRKEEDTRVFRLARRRMSRRRGWMLKSRAFKTEMKQLHVGNLRVSACNYLFMSKLQKYYSVGMQRKRAAWLTGQRLRFLMKRNPCLWETLQSLNISISFSDLISVLDLHPEWFSLDGTCLEAIRVPLRRLGLHVSYVPLSLLPEQVLNRSENHCLKYLFWRMSNGIGHYAHNFKSGDLCFEITDYLFLPGDLSGVVGSAKKKKGTRPPMQDLATTTSTNPEKKVFKRRRSVRLKQPRQQRISETCGANTADGLSCLICLNVFTEQENSDTGE